jgi:hypothetical protein
MFSELFGLHSTCCQLTKLLLFTANEFWTQLTKWRKWKVTPTFCFLQFNQVCVVFECIISWNYWVVLGKCARVLPKYIFINMILTERETIFIGNVWDGNLGSAINFLACSLSVSNFNILIRLRGSGVWAHVTEYNLDVYPLGRLWESEKKIRAKNSRSISVTSCSSATN